MRLWCFCFASLINMQCTENSTFPQHFTNIPTYYSSPEKHPSSFEISPLSVSPSYQSFSTISPRAVSSFQVFPRSFFYVSVLSLSSFWYRCPILQ